MWPVSLRVHRTCVISRVPRQPCAQTIENTTIGPVGFRSGEISVDAAVLGVSGITPEKEIATTILEETSMLAGMISSAGRTIILADSSKLGRTAFGQFAPLSAIDILVTDSPPPCDLADALAEAEVEVIVAPE
jgi:DeoR family transcriptional regulator, fructose operon transcriptional repressor